MTRPSVLLLLLTLLAGTGSGASTVHLAEALAMAREHNPKVGAARADLAAATGRQRQAGIILPSNPVIGTDLARHTGPGFDAIDRGVSLSQEIEIGGQRGLRLGAADHDVVRATAHLADQMRLVDGEVRRAYAGMVASERRLALARESAALGERVAATMRRREAGGDVAGLDTELAAVDAGRGDHGVAAATLERARAVARLAEALGLGAFEPIHVAEELPVEALPAASEDVLVERALRARPDLAAAREERARLDAEGTLVHRRGLVPNPVLRAFYRDEVGAEHIAGGEIAVPLPLWNREQGTEAATQADADSAGVEVARLEREIPHQIHQALVRLTEARQLSERYARDVGPAAERATRLLERGLDAGYLGLPDVLTQRDRLLQARELEISTWLDLREAAADLIEAIGEEAP